MNYPVQWQRDNSDTIARFNVFSLCVGLDGGSCNLLQSLQKVFTEVTCILWTVWRCDLFNLLEPSVLNTESLAKFYFQVMKGSWKKFLKLCHEKHETRPISLFNNCYLRKLRKYPITPKNSNTFLWSLWESISILSLSSLNNFLYETQQIRQILLKDVQAFQQLKGKKGK